jgi:hypothetical protein
MNFYWMDNFSSDRFATALGIATALAFATVLAFVGPATALAFAAVLALAIVLAGIAARRIRAGSCGIVRVAFGRETAGQ